MEERIKLTDDITIGSQPSQRDLDRLAQEGYKSVFNLRTSGEEAQPMQPGEEAEEVEERGMEYHHIPVSMDSLDGDLVERFRDEMQNAAKPAFVHCRAGGRAGALSLIQFGEDQGLSGDEALEHGKERGFKCEPEKLANFVRTTLGEGSDRGTDGDAGWAAGEQVGPVE